MTRRSLFLGLLCVAGSLSLHAAPQELTTREADVMRQKVVAVVVRASTPSAKGRPAPPARTAFSEREVNAYLKYDAAADLPTGVKDPRVTLLGDGKVAARALVDLDAVRRSQPRGVLDPMAYMTGVLEVKATGLLRGVGGKATFVLESATASGIPIPKALLQELISHYSKSPEFPQGISLDKPFDLPAGIRTIEILKGAAAVIQ